MRRKTLFAVATLVLSVLGVLVFSKDTLAYWTDNNGKQCFAVQYQNSYVNTGRAAEDGNTDHGRGEAYSTRMVCANVDENGKVKSLDKNSGFPADNTHITDDLGLKIYVIDDNTIRTEYCTKTGKECENGSKKVTGTYNIDKFTSFKALAQAVVNSAPITYGGGSRRSLEDNITKKSAKEDAEEEYEATLMNEGGGGNGSICYDESGHLGWIFCPLIEGIGRAMSRLYDEIIQPFLVIEPGLISGDGTYTAWDIFRNIANIAFVILFLVVIISQLTGVGIDNYGIKRMLPKLIAAAILINLSYVICQLAIDISNILGNSLETLFTGIAAQINEKASSPAEYFSGLVSTVGTAIGITSLGGTALVSLAPLAAMGFAAIVPILLGLLAAILSVLFMFVILFVRKAIAILLVAVAPVAFVAYIMPNTKKLLFDKWLGIFKGILAVYPLAGALVGGGVLSSSIIVAATADQASNGNAGLGIFLLYMGALLLQVVPFFFLPRLFRGSLNAIGNLGNAITNRGRQFSDRARGAIEGSERLQDWQNRQRENAALGRANRTLGRLQGRADAGNLSAGQLRRFARASNIKHGIESRRSDENLIAAEAQYGNKSLDGLMNDWNELFDGDDDGHKEENLSKLTRYASKKYGAAAAVQMSRRLAEKENIANNTNQQSSMQILKRTMSDDVNFASDMRKKAPDAYQMIQDGGRTFDENGNASGYADLSHFTQTQGIATKVSDWAGADTETFRRSLGVQNEGEYKISTRQLEEMLTSNDPAIRSGLMSEDGKYNLVAAEYQRRTGRPAPSSGGGPIDIGPQPSA